jgi:hypothetical protein
MLLKLKEANKVPLEMNLEESRNWALTIEEASVNPGRLDNEDEGNSKQKSEKCIPKKRKKKREINY